VFKLKRLKSTHRFFSTGVGKNRNAYTARYGK